MFTVVLLLEIAVMIGGPIYLAWIVRDIDRALPEAPKAKRNPEDLVVPMRNQDK